MKTLKYSLAILVTWSLTACDDFLDKSPLNNVTDATFFKTEADIKQFTDGFYKSMVPGPSTAIFDFRSDLVGQNMAKSGNRSYADLQFGTMTPTSGTVNLYWDFVPIRNAYILLGKIDEVEMSEDAKKLYLGTTNYLLAYRHFMMFRAYENAPVIREVLEIDNSDIGSSPKEEVFKEALDQVNSAISNLPGLSPTERERGRLTKLVALTLKADLLLYTACRYKGEMAGASYKDAADATTAALAEADARGYKLADNYQHLFHSSYQANSDPQQEIIFEYVRLKDIATDMFCVREFGPRHDDVGYGDYASTQELIDMYQCTDGKPINKSPLYDPNRPFEHRDPRLKMTTLYPGNICSYVDGESWVSNTLDPDESNYDYMLSTYNQLDRSVSGYINIKYWDHQRKGNEGYASFIAYRYGELLLMHAEAMNEAYGPSAEVYGALTRLRARATVDMPPVTAADYPTKESVRAFIRNERAVELFGEGKRYWDIRRWGAGEELMNKSFYSMHISRFNPDGSLAGYMDKIYVRTDPADETQEKQFEIPDGAKGGILMHTGVFNNEKFYVWPIPESAIDNSFTGALQQHPLWK